MAKSRRYYIDGNTVRVRETLPARREEEEILRVSVQPEQRPVRVRINVPYVLTLLVVTLLFGYLCFSYLKVNASINASMNRIASLEQQLVKARAENAVMENRLSAQMDLEEVFRIAVEEMGMVYPDENEVVEYTEQMREYVRQHENVPSS
ncbi:MAG: hypothetical protein IJL47_03030 [Lachnospiraceae bacterium]|nr:hypothetical protein [Lachnospiraceae bacterium]MBQ6197575.1 hypothetical protein [Lachnospiraceae bacterium]